MPLIRNQSRPQFRSGFFKMNPQLWRSWTPSLGQKLALVTVVFLSLWLGYVTISHLGRVHSTEFATQINEAGKLRMYSQRIAYVATACGDTPGAGELCRPETLSHLLNDYDASLQQVESLSNMLFLGADRERLATTIAELRRAWADYRQAAEQTGAAGLDRLEGRDYIQRHADGMLERAQGLVELLVASENKAQTLRGYAQNTLQLMGLLLLMLVAFIGYRQGVKPLRELVLLSRRAGIGDYSGRLNYEAGDEIGELVEAFNYSNVRTERLIHELETEAAAARKANAESDSLLESAADGIVIIGTDGRILKLNREAERIFGYPRQELIAKPLECLVPDRYRHQHKGHLAGYLGQATTRPMGRGIAVMGRRRDGSEVPLEISLSPASIGEERRVIAVVRDVSERVQAEADRLRLVTILDATPDVIAIFTEDGALVHLNPAGRQLLGMGLHEKLEGRTMEELLTPAARRILSEKALPTTLQQGIWRGELTLQGQGGQEVPVSQLLIAHDGPQDAPLYFSTIARDISERKSHEAELLHRATHDALTGLANRVLFEDRLRQAIVHAKRDGSLVAVMFIDLDNFKLVNDTMGHAVGDELLCEVARRLDAQLREGDTKARLGGDEFAVILENLHKVEEAASIVGELAKVLQRPIRLKGHDYVVTASMGISLCPINGTDAEALLMQADSAMYEAKAAGRNGYSFYTSDMNQQAAKRLDTERELRQALEQGELRLHYQPIVCSRQERILGCEALLRWQHPQQGLITPERFITVAEESGLIIPIGQWVLEQACCQAQAWRQAGLPLDYVAVNISAKQLRNRGLVTMVNKALAETQLAPSALELELTEGSVLQSADVARNLLGEVRELGVRLVADDFGTGYSSLSYLKLFHFDKIKIDREFVRDLLSDEGDAAIAKATVAMAHAFEAQVVAEGVETQAQADQLKRYGCDLLQGYLFAQPLEASAFEQLLQAQAGGWKH